jgi:REP element-mobilizing transposase RayT
MWARSDKSSGAINRFALRRSSLMVAGFHLIWTAYGWWLPNDPRGSSSHEIRVERIAELGQLHYGRKAIQPAGREIQAFYEQARQVLKHPLLTFNEEDRRIIGAGFRQVIAAQRYTCYACAIMPDHVHVLIRKHKYHAETMIEQLQAASKGALVAAKRREPEHPVWGGPGWKVFLYTPDDIRRIVRYIQDNPRKGGLPPQPWDFVRPYDGWLPGGAKRYL